MPSEGDDITSQTDRCRECGRAVAPEANFCPGCGADLGDPSDPAYCPECGERFDDDDRFCSNCGAARSDEESTAAGSGRSYGTTRSSSRAASSPRESELSFRRRVQDHLNVGWEIERDTGDSVVLVDRGIGSVGVHVLLLLTTGGIGNLLYGWWHYSELAERRRLVRDGSMPARSTSSADDGGRAEIVSTYLLSGLLLVVGGWFVAVAAGASSPPIGLIGLAFVLLGIGNAPPVRRRLDRRHGLASFGRRKTVDDRVIGPPESVDEPCVVCDERFDRGLVRRRRDETVVAGVPVRTHSMRRNHYCADCARREVFGGDAGGEGSDADAVDSGVADPEFGRTEETEREREH